MFDLFRSRDKAVRILLGAILMLVALSMVTYLIPGSGGSGFGGGSANSNVAIDVGGEKVSAVELQRMIQNAMRQGGVPPSLMQLYIAQIIQQAVTAEAMLYEAKRQGLRVTDEDINVAVQNQLPPGFFADGKLVKQAELEAALAQQGMTIADVRNDIARQLLVTRLRDIALEGTIVSPQEVEKEYRLRNEKAKIDYVVISAAKVQSSVKIDDAAMKSYYDKNKSQFQTPAKKSVAYIVFDPAQLENTIPVNDAELQRAYASNMERWRIPERARARHILVKSDPAKKDDDPENVKAKNKAEDLLKQIKGGADFAELAKKNSDDPGSGSKGGELGWVIHGQMVKPFEQAVFSLKPGQTSDLVKTQYGYHIVQVEEKEEPRVRSYDEVKPELIALYRKEKVNGVLQAAADKAQADLRRDPAHPEKAAADVNQPLLRADNVAPGDPYPVVGVSDQFDKALDGLKKGDVTAPVVLAGNKIAIGVLTDLKPAHPSSFEEAQPEVRKALEKEGIDVTLTQKASDLLAKAKQMGDLKKAAASMGLEMKTSQEFDRNGTIDGVGSATLLPDAFSKPLGTFIGPITADNNRVVAKIVEQKQPDMAAYATQRAAIRDEIKSRRARERNTIFEGALTQKLKDEKKVKINQEVINRITANFKNS